jgi:hypothetical protein
VRKNHANIAPAHSTPTMFETAMLRSRKSRSGTSGERTRPSITRKIASRAADAASSPSVRPVNQPTLFPFTIAYTAMTSDAVTVIAPATSSRLAPVARRAPGTTTSVKPTTRTPTGTLTRKIQCQSRASVRMPPSRTPSEPPPEATKPKMPIAFARSAGSVKRVIISERATAETTAPPLPARRARRRACPASSRCRTPRMQS